MYFRTDFTPPVGTAETDKLYVPSELQEARLLDAVTLLNHQIPPYELLDVGCGFANLLTYTKDKVSLYTGIDTEKEFVDACRIKYPEHQFEHLGMDAMSPELDYDIVVCLGVASYLVPTEQTLRWFVETLCASARKAVIIEFQDKARYKGFFSSFDKEIVAKMCGISLSAKTFVQRDEDSTFTIRMSLI